MLIYDGKQLQVYQMHMSGIQNIKKNLLTNERYIIAGDSYTWGESLLYIRINQIFYITNRGIIKKIISLSTNIVEANRFKRIIAKNLRFSNGGNNNDIFDFIDKIETKYQRRYIQAHNSSDRYFTYKLKDCNSINKYFRADVVLPNGNTYNISTSESINQSGFIEFLRDNFYNNLDKFIS